MKRILQRVENSLGCSLNKIKTDKSNKQEPAGNMWSVPCFILGGNWWHQFFGSF